MYSEWRGGLDKVFVRINGEAYYLGCSVVLDDEVLEVHAKKRRGRKAMLKTFKCRKVWHGQPKVIVTDHLRLYRAMMNIIGKTRD
jgi:transposase-like protein